MDRIRLDYQRREAPLPRGGLLVLFLAVALSVGVGGHYRSLSRQLSGAEAALDRLENTAHRRGILVRKGGRAGGDHGEEIAYANEVLRQLTLPWDQLFDTIEASGSKDVALLTLAPDRDKQVVRIGIEAKNADAAFTYLRTLEARDIFASVRVQSHQIQSQDPEKPIRFALEASWKELP
jgi:hypothetical protein